MWEPIAASVFRRRSKAAGPTKNCMRPRIRRFIGQKKPARTRCATGGIDSRFIPAIILFGKPAERQGYKAMSLQHDALRSSSCKDFSTEAEVFAAFVLEEWIHE